MTRLLPLVLLLAPSLALAGSPVQQPGNLGLGLGGGTHVSGLSGKYFLANDFAAQAVVGWWGAGRESGGIGVSADALWELPRLAQTDSLDVGWNVGPGANLVAGNNAFGLGVNGVLGLEFHVHPVPIDLVIEYRPGIAVIPDLTPDLIGFGAHIRVYPF